MNNTKLENKIVSLIPSKTIRKAIKETKHKFADIELVQIITEFAPSWEEMMQLLLESKKYIDDSKVKKYITQLVDIEKKQYKLLITQEEGYIYDVVMNPTSQERYLVPDFESAFITINNYIKCYKKYFNKNDFQQIEIQKRKVSKRLTAREVDRNEELVSCVLNEKKEIRRIYSDLVGAFYNKLEMELHDIQYPDVFKAGDLVYVDICKFPKIKPYGYYNYHYKIDDDRMYGINSFDNYQEAGEPDMSCFLQLSSEYVFYRKIELDEDGYCSYLMCHHHMDFGYMEKADLDSVPDQIKEDYEYATETLKKLNCL